MGEDLRITPSDREDRSIATGAVQGASILTVSFLVVGILGYIFNILLSWLLPVEQYGGFGVAVALFGITGLFVNVGFPWAVTKFISAETHLIKQYKIFKSAIVGNILTAVLLSIVLVVVFSFPPVQVVIEKKLGLLLIVTLLLSSSIAVHLNTLQGLFRFKQLGGMQILQAGVRTVAGFTFAFLGYGALGAFAGYFVAAIVAQIIVTYLLRNFKFWQAPGWIDAKIYTFAPAMFLSFLGITLLSNMDLLGVRFISEITVSEELTGYYQSILIIARVPFVITGAMMMAIFPFISKFADSDSQIYPSTALKYASLFVFPVSIMIAIYPSTFITLLFPDSYIAGANALRVIAVGMAFLSIIQVLAYIFQALGKPWTPAILLVILSMVQLGILLVLVPRWGLVGGAVATTVSCFLGVLFLLTKYRALKRVKIQLVPILKFLMILGILGYVGFLIELENGIWMMVFLVIAAVMYVFLLLLLRLVDENDINIIGGILPSNKFTHTMITKVRSFAVRLNEIR